MPLGMTYSTHRKPYMMSGFGGGGGTTRVSAGGGVRTGGGTTTSTTTSPRAATTLAALTKDYQQSRAEQEARYKAGLGELAEAAGLFGPGFTAGMEHEAMAGAKQSLIGRGLGGTTRPMAVGAGLKAQFEGLRRGKLADMLTRMAEYRRTSPQIYPGAGVLANLALGAKTTATQEQAMYQPLTISGGAAPGGGGPAYQAAAQSWAQPFGVSNVSNVNVPDFSLPFA